MIQLEPPAKHARWKRSPLYWSARQTRDMLADDDLWPLFAPLLVIIFALMFCVFLYIRLAAAIPLRWSIFEAARREVRELGEYA